MPMSLKGSGKDGFSPPLRPSPFCLSEAAEQQRCRSGRGAEVARGAGGC